MLFLYEGGLNEIQSTRFQVTDNTYFKITSSALAEANFYPMRGDSPQTSYLNAHAPLAGR